LLVLLPEMKAEKPPRDKKVIAIRTAHRARFV
jgi:hypothetical protein